MAKQGASTFMHPTTQGSNQGAAPAGQQQNAQAGQQQGGRQQSRGATKSYHVLSPIDIGNGQSYKVGQQVDLDEETSARMLRHGIVGDKSTDDSESEVSRADYQSKREDEAEKASLEERQLYADLARNAKEHSELQGHLGAASTLGSEVIYPEAHEGAEPLKYAGKDLESQQGSSGDKAAGRKASKAK